jgi:AIPR protein
VRSEKNINHGIKESASQSPQKFWAFNNGITAVVNDWTVGRDADDKETLNLSGMAIVNGAQTTGALGSVAASELAGANVLARFIKCDDLNTVRDIIRFNNRQNPTQAADFRSNDRVQRRLREEFADLKVVDYSGGRRGASDVIKRPADNMIAAPVAAQALAAFHITGTGDLKMCRSASASRHVTPDSRCRWD